MPVVMIIDDQPVELSALRGLLGDAEYDYDTATSGSEARTLLETTGDEIDAILLDWMLPDCDGVDLLRWIKEQPGLRDLEVVIQSAEIVPDRVRAGIDCGAYYYLTKPYEPAQLRAIVKSAVSSRQLKRLIAQEVEAASDILQMLEHATFLVRTVQEAQALAVRLGAACQDPDKGVGLFELMVNAIEHGNLGITDEDKSRLLEQRTHKAEIRRRLELAENRQKRARVEVKRGAGRLHLVIRDCGTGFDYRKYLTVDPKRLFDAHGRGILVAGNAFDIEYVEPGNEVHVSFAVSS